MNPRYFPLAATIAIFIVAYAVCIGQYPNMLSTRVIGNLLTDNAFLGIAALRLLETPPRLEASPRLEAPQRAGTRPRRSGVARSKRAPGAPLELTPAS